MTKVPGRIAYFNGRFLLESEVLVPFRDRGFKYGDAVFDTTRTFGHRGVSANRFIPTATPRPGYIEEPAWIGLEGYECTHRPGDLVRTTA